jgi:hypothetical protein
MGPNPLNLSIIGFPFPAFPFVWNWIIENIFQADIHFSSKLTAFSQIKSLSKDLKNCAVIKRKKNICLSFKTRFLFNTKMLLRQ